MKNETKVSLNLYQRINKVMGEISYLKKTANIKAGSGSYSAITHDHVTQSLQPLIVKHGLVIESSMANTSIERYEVKTKYGVSERYETRTTVEVSIVNIDNPNERTMVKATAHGFDGQDKSVGKAYSMAVKYALLKLFMIASGDEEEERVEVAKMVNSERSKIENELSELLKSQNKLDNKSIAYMRNLDIQGLKDAITRNKEVKNE